jgi:hypothetical protein
MDSSKTSLSINALAGKFLHTWTLPDSLTKIVQVVASAQDLHLDDCPVLPLEAGYIRIRFHSLAGDQAVLRTLAQRT